MRKFDVKMYHTKRRYSGHFRVRKKLGNLFNFYSYKIPTNPIHNHAITLKTLITILIILIAARLTHISLLYHKKHEMKIRRHAIITVCRIYTHLTFKVEK